MSNAIASRAGELAVAPSVAIILVSFKGLNDTLACLDSLSKLTYRNIAIVLVDQNSKDGTPEAVRSRYPSVQVIENPVNNGFTGGNNVGMQAALSRNPDYVFLLNNDTVVEPGLLEKLVAPMEADPRMGIIGPTMLYFSEPETLWWAGSKIDWRGRPIHYGSGESVKKLDMTMRDTGYVCGCGMLIRRAVLEQVGLLDDRFFIYFEEADLCARARRAGWRIVYLPSAQLWHKISKVTEIIGNDFGAYHWNRNRLLYLWKNGNPRLLVCLVCIASGLKAAFRLFFKGKPHEARIMLRALKDSLTGRWGSTFFSYKR
jgi:GT2 family glycosyltransferase